MAVLPGRVREAVRFDTSRPARLAAIGLGMVSLALVAASVPLAFASHQTSIDSLIGNGALILPFAGVGLIVAVRQPRNAMGWILFAGGSFFIVNGDASMYSILDYRMHRGLPLGSVAVLLQPTWAPAIVLLGLAILLFPDAKLPSRGWRWVTWTFCAMAALWMVGAFTIAASTILQHKIEVDPGGNLTTIDHPTGAWAWWGIAQNVFFPILGLTWLTSLARQVATYRRSTGDRRAQLKWVMSGATVCVIGGFLSFVFSNGSSPIGVIATVGLAALPVSIGVAILKYRLYDIDRIISRSLSYAVVTGLLVGVYVGMIALTTRVIPLSSSVGVAASTLAAAALFTPLRRRVQYRVDRRFNRAGYDSAAMVSAFTLRLRDAVQLETVRTDLLTIVSGAVEPAHVALWIRPIVR